MGTKLSLKEIDRQITKEESDKIKAIHAKKEKQAREGKIIKK